MKNNVPKELIDKFLKGECSPAEERLLNRWFNSFEGGNDPTSTLSEEQKLQLKSRMFKQIRVNSGLDMNLVKKPRKIRGMFQYAAAVAAVLLMIFSAGLLLNRKASRPDTLISQTITIKNTSERLFKHTFPDGSTAWMHPLTKITYNRDFQRRATRNVVLEGEAFFEVTKDAKHPFIIRTGDIFTKVLGTSFNVKTLKAHKTIEVSVVTGKVKVYSLIKGDVKGEVFLLPHQKVKASVSYDFQKQKETDRAMDIWQKNTLSFNNTPVRQVVKALNDKFKVEITIQDSTINNYQLNADFTDTNLPSVLELLSKSLGITYEINDKGITMSKPN